MNPLKKLFSFFWDKSLGVFLIIGGINTVVSYLFSFFLAEVVGLELYPSTAITYFLFSIPSFYFNRKFSFKSKAPLGKSIFRFAVLIFVCFHLSFLLNHTVMPWMHDQWFPNIGQIPYTLIRLLGIQVVFTMLNYVGQRLWAFKE